MFTLLSPRLVELNDQQDLLAPFPFPLGWTVVLTWDPWGVSETHKVGCRIVSVGLWEMWTLNFPEILKTVKIHATVCKSDPNKKVIIRALIFF